MTPLVRAYGHPLTLLLACLVCVALVTAVLLLRPSRGPARHGRTTRVAAGAAVALAVGFVVYVTLVAGAGPNKSTLSLIPGADTLPGLSNLDSAIPALGGLALNVVLFAPLGVAVTAYRAAHRRGHGPTAALVGGALLSLGVEAAQYALRGVTSIDDLIANTLGAWLGWLVARRLGGITGTAGPGRHNHDVAPGH